MIETLPVNTISLSYSVPFIFLLLSEPSFLTPCCLPLCSPVGCSQVEACLLFCGFSPHCFFCSVNISLSPPGLLLASPKFPVLSRGTAGHTEGGSLTWWGVCNGLGRWKGHDRWAQQKKKKKIFPIKQEHVFTVLSLLVHLPLREGRTGD